MLTEEEKTMILALDTEALENSGPASNGYSLNYMDMTGLNPDAPIEAKIEGECELEGSEELPEDFDKLTLCGWTETEPVALSAD